VSRELQPVQIARARASDLAALPAIEQRACELFRQVPATADLPLYLTPERDFEAALARGLLWTARAGSTRAGAASQTPVGFVLLEPLGTGLHLEELDVLPEYGRRGIGRRLVAAACAAAGDRRLTLCTFRDVPWNAPFYARLGFRELAPREWSPELAARVAEEAAHGLPPALRVVMVYSRPAV
jgi:4-diphosphocytidyl-2-C-methyl-D-erythritol kinase